MSEKGGTNCQQLDKSVESFQEKLAWSWLTLEQSSQAPSSHFSQIMWGCGSHTFLDLSPRIYLAWVPPQWAEEDGWPVQMGPACLTSSDGYSCQSNHHHVSHGLGPSLLSMSSSTWTKRASSWPNTLPSCLGSIHNPLENRLRCLIRKQIDAWISKYWCSIIASRLSIYQFKFYQIAPIWDMVLGR